MADEDQYQQEEDYEEEDEEEEYEDEEEGEEEAETPRLALPPPGVVSHLPPMEAPPPSIAFSGLPVTSAAPVASPRRPPPPASDPPPTFDSPPSLDTPQMVSTGPAVSRAPVNRKHSNLALDSTPGNAAPKKKSVGNKKAGTRKKKTAEGGVEKKKKSTAKKTPRKNIGKEGYLTKEGGGYKSWKKRLFVLGEGKIAYYAVKPDGKRDLKGEVLMMDVFRVEPSQTVKSPEFCIDLHTPKRVWHFAAFSKDEMESWLKALQSWHN